MTTRKEASALLRKYDKLKAELMVLEHQLNTACADYGRLSVPSRWGYTKDMLRNEERHRKAV